MKVFSLSSNEENIGIHIPQVDASKTKTTLWFENWGPALSDWEPPTVEILWHGHYDKLQRNPVDFPNHGFGCLVVSEKAKNALLEPLSRFGEFLPLQCSEEKFWAFHVLTCIDAIDRKKSTPLYAEYRDGRPFGDAISITTPYAFHCEQLTDVLLFRVPDLNGFFFTERFVELVNGLGLTGLSCRLEYDSELHKNGFDYLGEPI